MIQTKTMQETTYNALIGYNVNDDAVLLCDTFDYGDGFKCYLRLSTRTMKIVG